MENVSTYAIWGIPDIFGLTLLTLSLILTLSPFLSNKDFGIFKIPEFSESTRRYLRMIGPVMLLLSVAPFIPVWTPPLAHKSYLQALEFLNNKDSNHRLAAVQFFSSAAEHSEQYHWLMLEQLPAAVRDWAGQERTGEPCSLEYNVNSEGIEGANKRAAAPANRVEIMSALWALSGRNILNELPHKIPNRYKESDRISNYDEDTASKITLDHYRSEVWDSCVKMIIPQSDPSQAKISNPLDDVLDIRGTNYPEIRKKRWVDLSYADLSYANLSAMHLEGVSLHGARLCRASLTRVRLDKAQLQHTQLDRSMMWEANLREAWLERSSLRLADLGRTDLRDAWLLGTDLRGANFYQAKLDGAFFMGADLSDFETMKGASGHKTNFWRTRMVNANIGDRDLWLAIRNAQLEVAKGAKPMPTISELMSGIEVGTVKLHSALLREADLSGALFWNVELKGADFTGAKMEFTYLAGVDLSEVVGLTFSQLKVATIDKCTKLPGYITVEENSYLLEKASTCDLLPERRYISPH